MNSRADAQPIFFHSFRPLPVGELVAQSKGIAWAMKALQRSQARSESEMAPALALYQQFLTSDHVLSRATCLSDYVHQDWEKMTLFSQTQHGEKWFSPPLESRMKVFREVSHELVHRGFSDSEQAPAYLIQVTCTGYDSPTASQKLISERNWGETTKALHLGHMGCYAALPASSLAANLVRGNESSAENKNVSIFLVELCTLHLNPGGCQLQQVVMNTLFADGAIRFDVSDRKVGPSFRLLGYHEAILPESLDEMTWTLQDSAFAMTLSRAVPILIARNIQAFLDKFLASHGVDQKEVGYFAIHPGGPKIIELIADRLQLSPEQTQHSRKVFRSRGNMSSCTVPHIWDEILQDPRVPTGSLVVSMGFGPGLTVSANLLVKESQS